MNLNFQWLDQTGTIHIECEPNSDPEALGRHDAIPGLPTCAVTIHAPAQLELSEWNDHLSTLRSRFTDWDFEAVEPRR
jgi:hypothetical protein